MKKYILILLLLKFLSCSQFNFINNVKNNNYEEIEQQLQKNKDLYIKSDFEKSPILVAIDNKSYESLELLIDYNFNVNVKANLNGYDVNNAIEYAFRSENYKAASVIIERKDIEDKFTLLLMSIEIFTHKNEDIIQAVINNKYNLNIYNKISDRDENLIPFSFWLTMENKSIELIKYLENNKDFKFDSFGNSLLHYVASYSDHLTLTKLIKNFNYNVNATNQDGYTPLYNAIKAGKYKNVMVLLNNGADLKTNETKRVSIIHYLIKYSDLYNEDELRDIYYFLTEKDVDLNYIAENHSESIHASPIMYASFLLKKDIVTMLLNNNVELNNNFVYEIDYPFLTEIFNSNVYELLKAYIANYQGYNTREEVIEAKEILKLINEYNFKTHNGKYPFLGTYITKNTNKTYYDKILLNLEKIEDDVLIEVSHMYNDKVYKLGSNIIPLEQFNTKRIEGEIKLTSSKKIYDHEDIYLRYNLKINDNKPKVLIQLKSKQNSQNIYNSYIDKYYYNPKLNNIEWNELKNEYFYTKKSNHWAKYKIVFGDEHKNIKFLQGNDEVFNNIPDVYITNDLLIVEVIHEGYKIKGIYKNIGGYLLGMVITRDKFELNSYFNSFDYIKN